AQLARAQAELDLQVFHERRASVAEMAEQASPARVGLLHPLDLRPADGIGQPRRLVADVERLAAVDARRVDTLALFELEAPDVLRPRPASEPAGNRLVRLLVAGSEQARQRAVRRSGQEPAVAEERVGLVERGERPVGRQAALEVAPLLELPESRHALLILAPGG